MERNVDKIKQYLEEYFKAHEEIILAYIFGSVAKGKTNVLSDIDIAILVDKEKVENRSSYFYGYRAQTLTDLMKLLKTNSIDLIILNGVGPLLKHRVLYFGSLIYSKNKKRCIRFQVNTINEYNEFKHFVKPYSKIGGKDG